MLKRVAIIPARGGSKRIPRKNIKDFFGKPIISYSIQTAINSKCFDRIIVSTDDEEIAEISKKYGAEVPFLRPKDLSDDYTTSIKVISHAIRFINEHGFNPDFVCCLYPTAPLIKEKDIQESFEQLKASKSNYVFSGTRFSYPIQRALVKNKDNKIKMMDKKEFETRSQDLQITYHDAGQFYWGTADAFLNEIPFFHYNSEIFILPKERVQDIDSIDDWHFAEKLFSLMNK